MVIVVTSSHLLEHSLSVLPVTNQISYQKNIKQVKGKKLANLQPLTREENVPEGVITSQPL